ncbi:hypothetical protein BH23VER1_BH23VER1_02460 [soil metagenome]
MLLPSASRLDQRGDEPVPEAGGGARHAVEFEEGAIGGERADRTVEAIDGDLEALEMLGGDRDGSCFSLR